MKKLFVFAALVGVGLSGCRDWEYRYSEHIHEGAVVVDMLYQHDHYESKINMGMTTGGDLAFVPSSVAVPKKWGVVFQCKHGKFIVMGAQWKYEELWRRLAVGDSVDVEYVEVYEFRDDINNDSTFTLVDYDFINAARVN